MPRTSANVVATTPPPGSAPNADGVIAWGAATSSPSPLVGENRGEGSGALAPKVPAGAPPIADPSPRGGREQALPKPARRLPVQKDWPTAAIVAVQIGILVAIIAGWEIGAVAGFTFTFRSTILGFFIGTFAGSALGLSFWWSRNYAAIMQPYIICFESLPKLALAPLIVLVFGIGIASKIAIATALTLVVSTLTTFAGVKAVDPDGEKLFYSLGASRLQVFRKLVIPSCLPWIISVLRVNIGLALTGAIVGEFIASQHGLGRAIIYAGQTYDIALVWVAVSVLSALAVAMYVTVSWIERLLQRGIRG